MASSGKSESLGDRARADREARAGKRGSDERLERSDG